jgi:hypothetical protein
VFSTKNRDKVNDDRLGIKLSFTNEVGKYVEIYDEDTYLHILHYGFDGKYLPIGFDVLFIKDIKNMARLDGILVLPVALISTRMSLVMIVKSCYSKIVASIMACSGLQHHG